MTVAWIRFSFKGGSRGTSGSYVTESTFGVISDSGYRPMEAPVKKRLLRTAPLVVLLACWITSASAEEEIAEIGDTMVSIVPPDGWCRLESSKISDSRVVGLLRESMKRVGNTFVVAFADCGELERWRSARQRTLDNYGFAVYNNGYREFVYPGTNAFSSIEGSQKLDGSTSSGKQEPPELRRRTPNIVSATTFGLLTRQRRKSAPR